MNKVTGPGGSVRFYSVRVMSSSSRCNQCNGLCEVKSVVRCDNLLCKSLQLRWPRGRGVRGRLIDTPWIGSLTVMGNIHWSTSNIQKGSSLKDGLAGSDKLVIGLNGRFRIGRRFINSLLNYIKWFVIGFQVRFRTQEEFIGPHLTKSQSECHHS